MRIRKEINAILTIASRDFTRLLRDKPRLLISFIFPFLFIGVLGGSFQANLGTKTGFDYLFFVFTGVVAQTLFQSTASGIISLIEDRENNFSQELFITPISRYTLLIGKILGESLVSFTLVAGVIVFGLIIGVHITLWQLVLLIPTGLIACFFGGAFGLLVIANVGNQRSANQIFPLVIFPQFFLAGVFNPIQELPPVLFILSRIVPMTYAVDFIRNMFYIGNPEASQVILYPMIVDFAVIIIASTIFLYLGTFLFIRNEKNR